MEDPPIVELDVDWVCGCGGRGAGLEVLKEVQRVYEERLEAIERNGGRDKLQLQAALLRSWVGDLVGQNTLLARAVTQLERDATARLAERRRYNELLSESRAEAASLRRALARKQSDNQNLIKIISVCRDGKCGALCPLDNIHFFEVTKSDVFGSEEKPSKDLQSPDLRSFRRHLQETLARFPGNKMFTHIDEQKQTYEKLTELKMKNEVLQKENISKEREIRRLTKEAQQREHALLLKEEADKPKDEDKKIVATRDVESMVAMCCIECTQVPERERPQTLAAGKQTDAVQPVDLGRVADDVIVKSKKTKIQELQKKNSAMHSELATLRCMLAEAERQLRDREVAATLTVDVINELRKTVHREQGKVSCEYSPLSPASLSPDVSVIEQPAQEPIVVADSEGSLQGAPQQDRTGSDVEQLFFNNGVKTEPLTEFEDDNDDGTFKPAAGAAAGAAAATIAERRDDAGGGARAQGSAYGGGSSAESRPWDPTEKCQHNLEATVRVQRESLAVAEARIKALAARNAQLRRERARTAKELRALRRDSTVNEKVNASAATDTHELEKQRSMVRSLQSNLAVIEELYRDCFYETVKQDEMIELLRNSVEELRALEQERSRHSQRDRAQRFTSCQNIATEVENLKSEISNFVGSSNNDSGMWEAPPAAGELAEELQAILRQLRQLQRLLPDGDHCTCGYLEELNKTREQNDQLQSEVSELRQRIAELEQTVEDKNKSIVEYKQLLDTRETELERAQKQLLEAEAKARASRHELSERESSASDLQHQLDHTKCLLKEQTGLVAQAQQQRRHHEVTIKDLKVELANANKIIKEHSSSGASALAERAAAGARLRAAREAYQEMEACYREEARQAQSLRAALQQAEARGAELCALSARAVRDMRRWAARARETHRFQDEIIRQKDALIASLSHEDPSGASSSEPGCSHGGSGGRGVPAGSAGQGARGGQSCCGDKRCPGWRARSCSEPAGKKSPRSLAHSAREAHYLTLGPRLHSPSEELLSRIEDYQSVYAASRGRWHSRCPRNPHPHS